MSKLFNAILMIVFAFGVFKLMEYGFDGEMLFECHQMQGWKDDGHPITIPEYCYDLGLPRR